MYAHQVIEGLKNTRRHYDRFGPAKKKQYKDYQKAVESTRELISKAVKFHFEDISELYKSFGDIHNKILFSDLSEYIRLPFKSCWFDGVIKEGPIREDEIPVRKRGVLLRQFQPDLIGINIFLSHPDNEWLLEPIEYLVSIGRQFKDREEDFEDTSGNGLNGNIWTIPLLDHPLNEIFIKGDASDLTFVHYALLILNCRNIKTIRIEPSEKLNKKRKKQNKAAVDSYHVLRVKPFREKSNGTSPTSNKEERRIHFCRGHPKLFTKERPLFGKWDGLYWWDPYLRGNKAKGLALKDYQLKAQ
jgi:hypothetical protein